MIRHAFGRSGYAVARIGQGSWNLPLRGGAADEAKRTIRRGAELGLTHIDTAEMYGDGGSERLIGAAIRDLPRESLFIVSKVMPSNATYAGTIAACEGSLERLGCDYLDGFLLHWRGGVPLRETLRAMEQLVADGKVRALGVSNFDVDDLREAHALLEREPLACNQVLYHLSERTVEAREFAYCRERGIAIVGYTPFGRGEYEDQPGIVVLERVAKKHDATIRQIILAFLTRDPIAFAIPKASTTEHVAENAAAGDLVLDDADIEAIDRAFPTRERRGGLPTL
jgi:diketogulonate reductase-like aldo/keto reductase